MTAAVSGLTVAAPDGRLVLDGVDLELESGTVTAVVGESGAGKTTLAQALLGHLGAGLRISGGTVRVAGIDPFTTTGRKALRGRITGYLPQDPAGALDPQRRMQAQLRTAARIAHPRQDREQCVRTAIEAAAFEPALLKRHPAALSGGQAQRALLAWTFVTRPQLLILDEPTSGLDPETASRVNRAFTTLPWKPAVLVISHDHELVHSSADRVLEMANGRWEQPVAAVTVPVRRDEVGEPVLEASGITLRLGGRTVLDSVELCLHERELVAVRGISGSGKTSLARVLSGFTEPTDGTLTVQGRSLDWDAATRARKRQPFVAYVGQDARTALNPHETVRRTLQRAHQAAIAAGRQTFHGSEDLLKRFAVGDELLDRTPDRLSGGQRHRVALARALAAAPHVLVCDETTAALDHATADLVLDALDEWRRTYGTPMVLITHADRVASRAGRVLTLTGGRLR